MIVMGNRGDLTNEQWERIEPLLPKESTKRGRPAREHRQILNGMIWVLRTGAPWRDIPERYGKWTTLYSRFQHWRKAGIWDKLFADLQTVLDVESNVDWEIHFIDSTTIHIRCDGSGRLITFFLTPGQESDITHAEALMEQGHILPLATKSGPPTFLP